MAYKDFFSLVILVGKTLPIKNLTDDTLSLLSNLRNSRWRPRGQAYKENAYSVTCITPKILKMDSFPPNSCMPEHFLLLLIDLYLYVKNDVKDGIQDSCQNTSLSKILTIYHRFGIVNREPNC